VDTLLVAVEKEARQTGRLRDDTTTTQSWRHGRPPGRAGQPCPVQATRAIIEPLFAQLFTRF
jgi:hypothetical protein